MCGRVTQGVRLAATAAVFPKPCTVADGEYELQVNTDLSGCRGGATRVGLQGWGCKGGAARVEVRRPTALSLRCLKHSSGSFE